MPLRWAWEAHVDPEPVQNFLRWDLEWARISGIKKIQVGRAVDPLDSDFLAKAEKTSLEESSR